MVTTLNGIITCVFTTHQKVATFNLPQKGFLVCLLKHPNKQRFSQICRTPQNDYILCICRTYLHAFFLEMAVHELYLRKCVGHPFEGLANVGQGHSTPTTSLGEYAVVHPDQLRGWLSSVHLCANVAQPHLSPKVENRYQPVLKPGPRGRSISSIVRGTITGIPRAARSIAILVKVVKVID